MHPDQADSTGDEIHIPAGAKHIAEKILDHLSSEGIVGPQRVHVGIRADGSFELITKDPDIVDRIIKLRQFFKGQMGDVS